MKLNVFKNIKKLILLNTFNFIFDYIIIDLKYSLY